MMRSVVLFVASIRSRRVYDEAVKEALTGM